MYHRCFTRICHLCLFDGNLININLQVKWYAKQLTYINALLKQCCVLRTSNWRMGKRWWSVEKKIVGLSYGKQTVSNLLIHLLCLTLSRAFDSSNLVIWCERPLTKWLLCVPFYIYYTNKSPNDMKTNKSTKAWTLWKSKAKWNPNFNSIMSKKYWTVEIVLIFEISIEFLSEIFVKLIEYFIFFMVSAKLEKRINTIQVFID